MLQFTEFEKSYGSLTVLRVDSLQKDVAIKLPSTNFSWAYEMQVQEPDGHIVRFGTAPDDKKPFADSEKI